MHARNLFLCTGAALALLGLLRLAPDRATGRAAITSPPALGSSATAPIPPRPATEEPRPESDFPGLTTAPVLPDEPSPGLVASWHGRLRTPLRARGPAPDADLHLPLRFDFPLSAGRSVRVRIERHDETGPDSGVFTGTAEDRPGSVVILSYVGLAQAGVIQLPEERRSFVINGDESGNLRITECDLERAPGCTPPLVPPGQRLASASAPASTP
jgi:hypothetical protein